MAAPTLKELVDLLVAKRVLALGDSEVDAFCASFEPAKPEPAEPATTSEAKAEDTQHTASSRSRS